MKTNHYSNGNSKGIVHTSKAKLLSNKQLLTLGELTWVSWLY